MKADEVRLYALRGGLKKQSVCYTHFHSNEVFRGDLIICHLALLTNGEKCGIIIIGSDTQCGVLKYYYDK